MKAIKMKTKAIKKTVPKAAPLEENERIVAGALKGEAEIKAGLGKRFNNADEFIEYLRDL
jgi:hypothetical protein